MAFARLLIKSPVVIDARLRFCFFSNRPFQNFFYRSIQLLETSLIEKWSMVVWEARKARQPNHWTGLV